jgi:hypothetical protein
VFAVALLCWVVTSGSSGEHHVTRTPVPGGAAFESFPTLLVTTTDRRERALHTGIADEEEAFWVGVESVRDATTPVSLRRSVRPSLSILSAGAIPLAFAGRGPPSSTNA